MRYMAYHSMLFLACGILLHREACGDTAITNAFSVTLSSTNDYAAAWREIVAPWREIVAEKARDLTTNKVASQQGILYSDILTGLQYLDPKRVMSPDPRVRETAVKDILGKETYDLLEKRYLSQLTSADSKAEERGVAARILGWLLVSERAEQPLTDIAKTESATRVGYAAIQGLAALGDEDAARVLVQFLTSQKVGDPQGTELIKILKLSHTRLLEEHALEILETNKDCPGLGYELLFAIKGRKDIMEIIVRLFKEDYWMPENKESGDIGYLARGLAVGLLMEEICSREELCKNDPELRQKVVHLAENSVVKNLYAHAFRYLRCEGADEAYFERLLETPGLPPGKRDHIKKTIDIMKSGIRLEFKKNPETTLFEEPK